MKKILFLGLMISVSIEMCAQNEITGKLIENNRLCEIPDVAPEGDKAYFAGYSQESYDDVPLKIDIYDASFKLMRSFTPVGALCSFELRDFDNSHFGSDPYITQALFNYDEKIEYVVKGNEEDYNIVNEDGNTLYSFNQKISRIVRLNGIVYVICGQWSGYKTVYIIDPSSGSNTSVHSLKQIRLLSNKGYDIGGVQTSQNSKGIVISDGKKVVNP